MNNKRFNPAKLEKLNNPMRLKLLPSEYLIEKSGITNPKVIIDLGAGTGLYSASFSNRFKDCKVYATDISDIMVTWMKENRIVESPNLIPLLMEDSKINLDNSIGDFLFMINLHHELDNPISTLKESYRLLKPGGQIAISDWKKEKTEMGPNISIRISPHEIEKQLLECSFKNIKIFDDLQFNYLIVAEK